MVGLYDRKMLEEYNAPSPFDKWKKDAFQHFINKMSDKIHPFPCIPATIGFQLNHLRYAFIHNPEQEASIHQLADILRNYGILSRTTGSYASLIIFFEKTYSKSIEDYEKLFWKVMSKLNAMDEKAWPKNVSQIPHDPTWEFCFHGEAYFVYCATPEHSLRQSRYFPYMMLAVTPRWVLKSFHDKNPSKKIRSQIRERLNVYDTISPHPELNFYGNDNNYEWKQYYLRDDQTSLPQCPFKKSIGNKRE